MRSDEQPRRSDFSKYSQGQPANWNKPPSNEETLKSGGLQIERKAYNLVLKENPRGRFLRISEEAQGRRNAIIIPSTGLEEFQKVLDEMIKAASALPPKP